MIDTKASFIGVNSDKKIIRVIKDPYKSNDSVFGNVTIEIMDNGVLRIKAKQRLYEGRAWFFEGYANVEDKMELDCPFNEKTITINSPKELSKSNTGKITTGMWWWKKEKEVYKNYQYKLVEEPIELIYHGYELRMG